jgi:hypothetical protein
MFSCRNKNVCEGTFYQEWRRMPTAAAGKALKIPDNDSVQKFAIHKKHAKAS